MLRFSPVKGLSTLAIAAVVLATGALEARSAELLTLQEAISASLAQHPQMRQARLEEERAQVALDSANAERFTYGSDVALGDRLGVTGLLGPGGLMSANTPIANATVMARVPLFTGWKLSSQINQANAALVLSQARLEQSRQDLVWTVTEAYWKAHRSQMRAKIQAEAVDHARQSREVVSASFKLGRASANEVDRVEVSLLNQESDLLKAREEELSSRDELSTLLARDLSSVELLDPPTPGDTQEAKLPSLDQALKSALESRPDVRMAEAELTMQQAALGAARADLWPQIDLVSAYQHGNNPFIATSQNRSVLDSFVGTWDARLNVSYRLFDHGAIGRNIQRSEVDVRSAETSLQAARQRAELEVRQAHRRMALANQRVALGRRSETLAQANLKWLEGRFKFGYALPVEMNEARMNLISSRNQRVDALIDYQIAQSQLQKAMGRLDVPAPQPAVKPSITPSPADLQKKPSKSHP